MACSHTSFVLTHPPIFLHQTVEHLHMVVDLFGHLSAFFFFDNWRGHGLYFLWHAVKYLLALLSFEVNHIKDNFSLLLNTHNGQDSNRCSWSGNQNFQIPTPLSYGIDLGDCYVWQVLYPQEFQFLRKLMQFL